MLLPMMGLFLTLGNIMPPLRLLGRAPVAAPAAVVLPVLDGVTVTVGLGVELLGLHPI